LRRWLTHVFHLGTKELRSLRRDPVLVFLIVYVFTFSIWSVARGVRTEVRDAAVAVVDEDRSELSRRIVDALQPPFFRPPVPIPPGKVDRALDAGWYTFVLDIPPGFEADLLAGRRPALQVNVDATAITQAGVGLGYIETIALREVQRFAGAAEADPGLPIRPVVHARFNPNLQSDWFTAVMQLIDNVSMLAIILVGAAAMRERERGTLEHLLVMPLRPSEIMVAKIWANGLVILVATLLSLRLVVQGLLGVPVAGSVLLFAGGTALYLASVTALGILLATLTRSMPQFALLTVPVIIVMNLLSGGSTPLEAMPSWLRHAVQLLPSTHFVAFAQGVLYRGAGPDTLWPDLLAMLLIGAACFVLALARFRAALAAQQG
jgi:ABC-2 type transport system permease protein